MFCPSCGARNPDDSRFCNHCGVRQPDPSARPSPRAPAPPPPAASAAPQPRRLPTMGDGAHEITLPLSGPSPRALAFGGAGLALGGLIIGAAIAWRAARRTVAPPLPETHVELIERPRVLRADAGALAAPSPPPETSLPRAALPAEHPAPLPPSRPRSGNPPTRGHTPEAPARVPPAAPATVATPTELPEEPRTTDASETPPSASPSEPPATASTDATGVLDSAEIQSVYRAQRLRLAACQLLVSGGGETVGALRVRVRVGTDGRVLRTSAVSNTTHNEMLSRCVQTAIREWQFPAPRGGEAEFEYTLGFGA